MRIISAFILLSFSFVLNAQDVFEEQNQKIILREKIKSITQSNFQYKGGEPAEQGYKNSYKKYDQEGNLTEEIKYKRDGEVFLMMSYKYDDRGNQVGYVRYDGRNKKVTYKKACRFNDDNNLLKEAGFDGASQYKNVYDYDARGRLTSIKYYLDDFLTQVRKFVYDGNNREIKVYDGEDNYQFKLTHKYDDQGNLINETRIETDGSIHYRTLKDYNNDGKVISETRYERGNFSYKISKDYNSSGKLLKVTEKKADGTSFIKQKYIYNAKGLLLKEEFRKKSSSDFSYKHYSYNNNDICESIESFYASYNYKVLFKMEYEFY